MSYGMRLLIGQPNGGSPKFQGGSPKLIFFFLSNLFVSLLFTQQGPQDERFGDESFFLTKLVENLSCLWTNSTWTNTLVVNHKTSLSTV